jgi:hypothetical protein
VVRGTAYRQGWNTVLARDAAKIAMNPFGHTVVDRWPSLRCAKHHMNQTTYVTVRHGFPPSLPKFGFCVQVYPGPTSWVIFSRPCGTVLAGNVYPALRAGLLSAVPSGLVPTHPDDRFVFSKCWLSRPIVEWSEVTLLRVPRRSGTLTFY